MIEYEAEGPVAEEDIEELEVRLGLALPEDYRTWLKETNGAHVDSLGVENGLVNSFVGVLDDDSEGGLAQRQEQRQGSFGGWVPAEYLLVSYGAGGAVCLKVEEPDRGSVWWADYDAGAELAPEGDRAFDPLPVILSRLADNWSQFISGYEEPPLSPEEQAQIDDIVARSDSFG